MNWGAESITELSQSVMRLLLAQLQIRALGIETGGDMKRPIFILSFSITLLLLLAAGMTEANSPRQNIVTASQVNGTWRYRNNTFKIWALGNQKLKVEFFGTYEYKVSGEMMANTGTGDGIAHIEGDTAIFKPDVSDDECKITMKFTQGKLVVDQEGICGFGHNVSAAGTYRKISSRKPKFDSD